MVCHKKSFFSLFFFLAIADTICRMMETKEKGRKMIEILYISDCCGAYLADDHVEYGICPDCHEHCEVIWEEYTIAE